MPVKSHCPSCDCAAFQVVNQSSSRAPGRIPYRLCRKCGAAYRPSQCWTLVESGIGALVGLGLIAGAIALVGQDGVERAIPFWMAVFGLMTLAASALFRKIDDGVPAIVELVGEAHGQASEQARARLIGTEKPPTANQALSRAGQTGIGWVFTLVGALLGFMAMGLIINITQGKLDLEAGSRAVLLAVAFIAGIAGTALHGYGKRLKAPLASEVLRKDGRAPIMLLRSFVDDFAPLPKVDHRLRNISFVGYDNTLEDTISKIFEKVGPVVAIGRPGEKLPPSGAARVWLPDDEWKDRVQDFLACSAHVVMLMGQPKPDDGLSWEISQVFQFASPPKIALLVAPHLDEAEVKERWDRYVAISNGRMPEYQPRVLMIRFRPDWTPLFTYKPDGLEDDRLKHFEAMKSALEAARDFQGMSSATKLRQTAPATLIAQAQNR